MATIIDQLINNFSNDVLIGFFSNSGNFYEINEKINIDEFIKNIDDIVKIGELKFNKNEIYGIYSIKANNNLTDRSSKKQQYDIEKKC